MSATDDVDVLRAAIARLARQLNLGATQAGLTPSQASALGLIASRGPLGVAELAELDQVNPSMVSRIVGKLVAAGLIERNPGPEDARTALVHSTDRGRAMIREIKDRRSTELRQALESLSGDEQASLRASIPVLNRLAEALRAQVESGRESMSGSGWPPGHAEDRS